MSEKHHSPHLYITFKLIDMSYYFFFYEMSFKLSSFISFIIVDGHGVGLNASKLIINEVFCNEGNVSHCTQSTPLSLRLSAILGLVLCFDGTVVGVFKTFND